MSEQALLALSLPLLPALLVVCWLILRISRHSNFRFTLKGLGVSVEIVSTEKDQLIEELTSHEDHP